MIGKASTVKYNVSVVSCTLFFFVSDSSLLPRLRRRRSHHHNYCCTGQLLSGSIWGGMWTKTKIAYNFFHQRRGWNPWTKVYNNNTWSPLLSLTFLGGPALSRCGRQLFFRSSALPPPSTSASANLPTCYWWSRPRCWSRESSSSSPSSPSASRAWPTCHKVIAFVQDHAKSCLVWFGINLVFCLLRYLRIKPTHISSILHHTCCVSVAMVVSNYCSSPLVMS